ncbi:hypothetical protein HK104_008330 [Borealophlyctis nickersoniae]|nr:hypothetical protein HK104_008330 [Borealophlyctis nickersoniae]
MHSPGLLLTFLTLAAVTTTTSAHPIRGGQHSSSSGSRDFKKPPALDIPSPTPLYQVRETRSSPDLLYDFSSAPAAQVLASSSTPTLESHVYHQSPQQQQPQEQQQHQQHQNGGKKVHVVYEYHTVVVQEVKTEVVYVPAKPTEL